MYESCTVLQEAVRIPEEELPLRLPETDNFKPSGMAESPLANITEWMNYTDPKTGTARKAESIANGCQRNEILLKSFSSSLGSFAPALISLSDCSSKVFHNVKYKADTSMQCWSPCRSGNAARIVYNASMGGLLLVCNHCSLLFEHLSNLTWLPGIFVACSGQWSLVSCQFLHVALEYFSRLEEKIIRHTQSLGFQEHRKAGKCNAGTTSATCSLGTARGLWMRKPKSIGSQWTSMWVSFIRSLCQIWLPYLFFAHVIGS